MPRPGCLFYVGEYLLSPMRQMSTVVVGESLRVIGRLPLEQLQALGRGIGRRQAKPGQRAWETTCTNLALCLPDLSVSERAQLARASLECSGQVLAESLWVAAHARVDAAVANVSGYELADDIARATTGAIALVPHLGNWELLHAWIAARQRLAVLYRPARNRWLAALVERLRRRRGGSTLVPADRRGVAVLARTLRAGGIVAILPDQVPDAGAGVATTFFGRPALSVALPARLALRAAAGTRPLIVLGSALRREDGRFDIHFERLQPREHSDAAFMDDVNRAIELLVRRYPAQYQWEYKRFKRSPDGARVYP